MKADRNAMIAQVVKMVQIMQTSLIRHPISIEAGLTTIIPTTAMVEIILCVSCSQMVAMDSKNRDEILPSVMGLVMVPAMAHAMVLVMGLVMVFVMVLEMVLEMAQETFLVTVLVIIVTALVMVLATLFVTALVMATEITLARDRKTALEVK